MVKSQRAKRWANRLSLAPLLLLGFIGIGFASQDNLLGMFIMLGIGLLGTLISYPILCPILSLFLKDSDRKQPRAKNSARTAHYTILIVTGLIFALCLLAGLNQPPHKSPDGLAVFIVSGVVAQFTYFILGILTSLIMGESIWTPEEAAMFTGKPELDDEFNNPFHPNSLLNPANPASPSSLDYDSHHHISDIPHHNDW